MKAIFRHLKKFAWLVVLFILFVGMQALLNLEIPRYTSEIVNVGIQQGGIESTVPEAIRQAEFDKLLQLSNTEDRAALQRVYHSESDGIVYRVTSDEAEEVLGKNSTIDFSHYLSIIAYLDADNATGDLLRDALAETMPAYKDHQGAASDYLLNADYEVLMGFRLKAANIFNVIDDGSLTQTAIGYLQNEYAICGLDTDKMRNDYIIRTGLVMMIYVVLIALFAVLGNYCSSRFGAGLARELRTTVFNKVMRFSHKELGKLNAPTLITRCTNDIQQIQMVLTMSMRSMVFAPIMGFGSLYMMITLDAGMAWVAATALIAILALAFTIIGVTMPKFQLLQKMIDRINQVARESLSGLEVVRAFSREEYENARFDKANIDLMKTNLFITRVMSIQHPAMGLIMNVVCVLIMWVGADLVNAGTSQVGDLLAYIQYAMHIVFSFMFISMISVQLPRAIISMRRVGEILEMPLTIENAEETTAFPADGKGVVEFRNVSFRYPGATEYVLHDINFTARPGETTAFIGSTGSGKSTLVNLLPRFFDVSEGNILVDGVDVRDVTLHDLRARIGFVPQKGQLFTGTIKSNIVYGDAEISTEQMAVAAKVAQAADFIEASPEKYDRPIAQGGSNVSGGQRQRLSIARAIAKDPDIYVFDDSFSALDFKTDAALRKALSEHTSDATVLIVAQRISTVLHAEQIIVLDQGKVVGMGRHEELLENCPVYRQIAISQLNEEELRA